MENKQLAKNLMAVRMMSGITLWFEADRVAKLKAILQGVRANWPSFFEIEGEMINPSSVEGIYTPAALETERRVKMGQWQCKVGQWHDRGEKCEHRPVVGFQKAKVEGVGEIRIPIYGK